MTRPSPAHEALSDDLLADICLRPLFHVAFPRVDIEAMHVKQRRPGGAVFVAIVVASGMAADDRTWEPLGIDVGDSEDPEFWRRFLLSLRARGLFGVEVVASSDHGGLPEAVEAVFPGATWLLDAETGLEAPADDVSKRSSSP